MSKPIEVSLAQVVRLDQLGQVKYWASLVGLNKLVWLCKLSKFRLVRLGQLRWQELYKKLVKISVINYWELTLRSEAALLSSLSYFKPGYMYLTTPHPLWTTAGASPSKIAMATVQARMISGKYPTQVLCRGNLLRSVPCVSVGHQHVNFFQKSFREKSFCMLVYIGQ